MMTNLRVPKSTKNKDDLRVLIAGVLSCIFLLLAQRPVFWLQDYFYAERPIISATVKIHHYKGRTNPMILYDADALQAVRGDWIATIYAVKFDTRLDSRRGSGNYAPLNIEDDASYWTWKAFFDNEKEEYQPPSVPDEPFYVCVRYDVFTTDSQFHEVTEDFCSEPFDPTSVKEIEVRE